MAQIVARGFATNLDHIMAEMALLDLRLMGQVQKMRRHPSGRLEDDFRGLFISEEQVDGILSGMVGGRGADGADGHAPLSAASRQEEELAARVRRSLEEGADLRLARLCGLYGLSDFERRVLVLCLAPELDPRYETLYAYLQDDVGKKRPTVALALALFGSTLAQRLELRRAFLEPSPLVGHELVHLHEDPYGKELPLLSRSLSLDPRVADYLLGGDSLDGRLQPCASLVRQSVSWDAVVAPDALKEGLVRLAGSLKGARGKVVQLVGPQGAGRKTVAAALSSSLGRPLLLVDCQGLVAAASTAPGRLVGLAFREALLQDAVLCWEDFHVLLGGDSGSRALLGYLARGAASHPGLSILIGEQAWVPEVGMVGQSVLTVHLPMPEYSERKRLWEASLREWGVQLPDQQVASLAGKFRFTGGQVRQVVATARELALWRAGTPDAVAAQDLYEASRLHSNQKLAALAHRLRPVYSWEDMVLPADQKAQLQEICGYFQNLHVVYGQWGFQRKVSRGRGLNVLFAGPSGTGKTMAAEIMAGQLGLDLYRIDLSTVVSKYIGETEKNLDRIFREAQDSNAILFFDEADALFGKRSEVRDSHDRYANIETSYLLQKMEEYEGIVILATNFRKNLDEAFVRRMHFAVEFPFPEEEYRLQIWERVFPGEAPLDKGVDLRFLARQFKVAGGNIKNIAVMSAFLAAQEGRAIGMEHIIRATKREYQKMGKLLVEDDFGPYYGLVKG